MQAIKLLILVVSLLISIHVSAFNNYVDTLYTVKLSKADIINKAETKKAKRAFKRVFWLAKVDTIRVAAIKYKTIDVNGDSIVASGTISYPVGTEIKGVIVSQHFTISANKDCPTESRFTPDSFYAFAGYAIIQTDYLGFGITKNMVHPYIHTKTMAQEGVNCFLAASEYMQSINKPISNSIFAMGYSQGGSGVLAFQKLVESEYADKIKLREVYAGAGPYDLVASFNQFIETNHTGFAGYLPYLCIGLNEGDNLNLDFSKIFKPQLLSKYDYWYNSKEFKIKQINDSLNTNTISDFISQEFLDTTSTQTRIFIESLKKNSLIDFTPKAKLILFHGKGDTSVPFLNSENAYNSFKQKGADVELIKKRGDHAEIMPSFYFMVYKRIKKNLKHNKQ